MIDEGTRKRVLQAVRVVLLVTVFILITNIFIKYITNPSESLKEGASISHELDIFPITSLIISSSFIITGVLSFYVASEGEKEPGTVNVRVYDGAGNVYLDIKMNSECYKKIIEECKMIYWEKCYYKDS